MPSCIFFVEVLIREHRRKASPKSISNQSNTSTGKPCVWNKLCMAKDPTSTSFFTIMLYRVALIPST